VRGGARGGGGTASPVYSGRPPRVPPVPDGRRPRPLRLGGDRRVSQRILLRIRVGPSGLPAGVAAAGGAGRSAGPRRERAAPGGLPRGLRRRLDPARAVQAPERPRRLDLGRIPLRDAGRAGELPSAGERIPGLVRGERRPRGGVRGDRMVPRRGVGAAPGHECRAPGVVRPRRARHVPPLRARFAGQDDPLLPFPRRGAALPENPQRRLRSGSGFLRPPRAGPRLRQLERKDQPARRRPPRKRSGRGLHGGGFYARRVRPAAAGRREAARLQRGGGPRWSAAAGGALGHTTAGHLHPARRRAAERPRKPQRVSAAHDSADGRPLSRRDLFPQMRLPLAGDGALDLLHPDLPAPERAAGGGGRGGPDPPPLSKRRATSPRRFRASRRRSRVFRRFCGAISTSSPSPATAGGTASAPAR